jgi:hypothetical protein
MQMKMKISHEQEWEAARVALERVEEIDASADHISRYNKALNFHDFITETAESIGAEYAVARYFGIADFTARDSRFKRTADVGSIIEVKWTKYDSGSLIIYDTDRSTDIAILVTGKSPNYVLKGWIPIAIAKNQRWRRRDQPTYWVEQYHLHPIENLRRSSHGEATLPMSG